MIPNRERVTRSFAYAVSIIALCAVLGIFASIYAWRLRHDGLGAILAPALPAVFFDFAASMLIVQALTRSKYKRAASQFGLVAFGRESSIFPEALSAILKGAGEVSVYDAYCGKVAGSDIHFFNYSMSPAWWSKTRSVAVLQRVSADSISPGAADALATQADAHAVVQSHWLVVQRSRRTNPTELKHWLESVVDALKPH